MEQLTSSAFTSDGRLRAPPRPGSSVLALFHTPWCPHCSALMPAWRRLASTTPSNVRMVMVDCQENTIPFVRSYPTLLLYDSTGRPRNVDSSLAYLADASAPGNPQVSIVYFYVPWCGHCRATSPEVAAFERHPPGGQRVLRINCEDNPDVAFKRGVQGYPTLQVIANGRHTEHVGGITRQELAEFYQRSLQMLLRE